MKNFKIFIPDTYQNDTFEKVEGEEGIYFAADEYSTCLSFEQEPEHGEGDSPQNISQYPMDDILDEFNVYIGDNFDELNEKSEKTCYREFVSPDIEDIKRLQTLVGKTARDVDNALQISDE